MKRVSLFILVVLLLFLAACGGDNALITTPNLASQFGTAEDEYGVDVTVSSTGQVYELSQLTEGRTSEDGGSYLFTAIYLTRYATGGAVVWQKEVANEACYTRSQSFCTSNFPKARAVYTDARNYVYTWIADSYSGYSDDEGDYTRNFGQIYQYSTAGNLIDAYYGGAPHCVSTVGSCLIDKAMDKAGIVYTARSGFGYGGDLYQYESVVTKDYVWERPSTVGVLYGIAVANGGSITVVGNQGMARYTNGGKLVWTKTGTSYAVTTDNDITVSGSNVYVRNLRELRKYDVNGRLLWKKAQTGLDTLVLQDMAADGTGNVYISGKYDADASKARNMNAFARKLNSSGSVMWTKTFGTSRYDDGRGIATINSSEIYVTGETQGSLAHSNLGGSENRNGYLRKLNSLGNPVWTR